MVQHIAVYTAPSSAEISHECDEARYGLDEKSIAEDVPKSLHSASAAQRDTN